jgi:rhamnulose-1-phosphate aldolase
MMINDIIRNEILKVSQVSGYLWQRGWAERNAGNISLDLTGLAEVDGAGVLSKRYVAHRMPAKAAGKLIFITGTGERLRELVDRPEKAACIIKIDAEAKGYHIVSGGEGNHMFRPTMEFVSHLSIHLYNEKVGNGHRCVLHTHPIELIAISHHPFLGHNEEALNKAIWGMLPEARVFIPRGISIAPYEITGSEALANATIVGLMSRDVVLWSKHGALTTGRDAQEAFDFMDVANKGVLIYLKCLQAGYTPEGLSAEEIKDLEILFNL